MEKYWIYDCFKNCKVEFRNTCIPKKKPIIIPQDACIGMAVKARTIAICGGYYQNKHKHIIILKVAKPKEINVPYTTASIGSLNSDFGLTKIDNAKILTTPQ